jgi:hypothetical protein
VCTQGNTLGVDSLLSFDFFISRSWIWGGVGFLLGSAVFFTICSGFALQVRALELFY